MGSLPCMLPATSITVSRTSLNSSVIDGSQDCLFARFTATYDKIKPGLAQFWHDAVQAYRTENNRK